MPNVANLLSMLPTNPDVTGESAAAFIAQSRAAQMQAQSTLLSGQASIMMGSAPELENQRNWRLPLGAIKSSAEVQAFEAPQSSLRQASKVKESQ